ncbi:MAG: diphosphomevalonate decarboxylase [Kofleriaceae bacterium]
MKATARACANIALVKYWGKRDAALNLPAAGSLSLTLDGLVTTTTVELAPALADDEVTLDGRPATAAEAERVSRFVDLVRAPAGRATRVRVTTGNDFPTASGLASSASGFAALALATTAAFEVTRSPAELSALARRGSGSAARSLDGGLVLMHAGARADGVDAFATALPAAPWQQALRMVIAVVAGGVAKTHGSRDAMEHCAATSPLYPAWIDQVPRDLDAALAAIAAGDVAALGALAEANALAMHATALAARPAIVYWLPATLAALAEVRRLRADGVPAWATMDAGPHVKVLTTAAHAPPVAAAMATVPGVSSTRVCAPGPAATVEVA